MLLTVADVLALDAVRRGKPQVVAGADRLDGRVRWVHVIELPEPAHLLRGGELVLITGIALPSTADLLHRYVTELVSVGVSGLALELGHRYEQRLPDALIRAAEEHGLPLITLERETPFIEITEAVHARIIDAQLAELRASQQLHEVFTGLSVQGAAPDEVVTQVARLAGRPAILENLAHQVLACEPAGQDPGVLLASWEALSRGVRPRDRTGYDVSSGWLVSTVGARGEDWGRLILTCPDPPTPRDVVLVERAATTLALGRLIERHDESLERQTHRTIIAGILAHSYADPTEAAARARAVGVPLSGRRLVAVVLRLGDEGVGLARQARLSELAETMAASCRDVRLSALVGTLDDAGTGAVLALPMRADPDRALTALSEQLHARLDDTFVMGVGSSVETVRDVRRSFSDAEQVADVAIRQPDGRPFYRLPDLRLRGLLQLLRDDVRLQTFVERELAPLLAHDAQHGTALIRVLGVYLECGRNKALTAERAHLSRPALYERLRKIGRVLDTDLNDAQSCASLQVALLALESVRGGPDRTAFT